MRKPFVRRVALFAAVLLMTCFALGIGFSGRETAAAAGESPAADRVETTRVMHISDTHILPSEFCNEYSSKFEKTRHSAKLVAESEAATITAFGEMLKMDNPPDIVIVSGDLTSDGEVLAHRRLAQILTAVTEKMRESHPDFQIFVTPGNHDLYNPNAKSFMPSDEKLSAAEDKAECMRNAKRRSVATATYRDFFEIYKDFGYAVVDEDGKPLNSDMYAPDVRLKFFYDSDGWYDDKTGRKLNEDGTVSYTGFDIYDPEDEEGQAGFEELGLDKDNFKKARDDFDASNGDYNYLARHSRAGIATFVAYCGKGVTVVSADGSNKDYSYDADKRTNAAKKTGHGWQESTGGFVSDIQMRWIIENTKAARERDDLILLTTHFNTMAHFPGQDEVLSKFVLDNMERFSATMAKNGIRYTFTGHQHANDISNTISQAGDVMYDIETGSVISYGSAYRILDFTREWKNGDYSETAISTMHSLGFNDKNGTNEENNDGGERFYYTAYKAADDASVPDADKLADSPIYPDCFDLFPHGDDVGNDSVSGLGLIPVRMYCRCDGEAASIGKLMTEDFRNVLSDMLDPFVNDTRGQLDEILGKIDRDKMKFTGRLLDGLVDGLLSLDLRKFSSADGKTWTLSAEPEKDYNLSDFLRDVESYLMNFDFSYGANPAKTTIPDLVIGVYGAHLAGTGGAELSDTVRPLVEKLEDGSFGRWLVDTVVDSVIPQLDIVLDAPVRFDKTAGIPADGEGMDLYPALKTLSSGELIDKEVRNLVTKHGFTKETADEQGHSSLKQFLANVAGVLKKIVNDEEVPSDLNKVKAAVKGVGLLGELSDLVDRVLDYIDKYVACGSLYEIVQTELMDKYITDAFLKNICAYAEYLLTGMDTDDTPDGSAWGEGDRFHDYNVVNAKDFNFATTKADDYVVDGVRHAYYRAKGTDGRIAVTPSEENGLLPAMINVFFGEDVCRDKTIRWFTSIDQDIFDKTDDGSFAFLPEEFAKPESFIRYSTSEDLSEYTEVKAETVNFERERPGIDLGIFCLSTGGHRYKFFNRHTVSLKDLKPGTTYYYRLGSDKYGWTETHTFATATDGDFDFLAIADIQGSVEGNYADSLPSLRKAVSFFGENGKDIAFIASMGDNVDYEKNYKQFEWWLTGQKEIWANHTMTTVAGNHDSAQILSDWLALPGRPDGEDGGLYYAFDYGKAHMIVVDTNDIVTDEETKAKRLSEKQTEWLVNELEASTKEGDGTPWTIVMLHKGLYTAGSHAFDIDVEGIRAQLTPIFYEYGVDVVLGGHDHTYVVSRFIDGEGKATDEQIQKGGLDDPSGVLYITLGTMGDKFYKYLYRDEVPVTQREITDERLKKYVTADGRLELTETPVFADVRVTGDTLAINTYTIIDGEAVSLDAITLTKGIVAAKKLSGGAIAGIVIGSVGGAAAVIAVVLVILKKKRI